MLFNSIEFLFFLPCVFFMYWFVFKNSLKLQNILLLIASYLFYGWWDWRFLSLIAFSTLLDYFIGIQMNKSESIKTKKALLYTSIGVNLGFLFLFKYYNFFIESFINAFPLISPQNSFFSLKIILPVGISFYTFQTLSYNIDIYKNKIKPTTDLIAFSAFVSFFPQLVAGPIERASDLLPQFLKERKFNYEEAKTGIQLMVWGFFKKIVIADNAAIIVEGIFNDYTHQSSLSLIIGSLLFAFQIYCDFSGYSDIAIGLARLFNFKLTTNFKFPYFAKNISDFWKRWHISLSSWFRDYVYIPLGGNRVSKTRAIINMFIVFLVSGLWHGANWTFIFWGGLHAIFYIPEFLGFKTKIHSIIKSLWTFIIVCIAWIFFRAQNITQAFEYIKLMIFNNNSQQYFSGTKKQLLITIISFIGIAFLLWTEKKRVKTEKNEVLPKPIVLILLILATATLGAFKNHANFIYFQF